MAPDPHPLLPISIWQPARINGKQAFERPDPLPFGDHYAARKQFFVQKSPETLKRICFFGESAAAGYLYAPFLTPAGLLEKQLLFFGGENAFEVIDLAKTNETLAGILDKVRSALQLKPDMMVIFWGNNGCMLETPEISPYVPDKDARMQFAQSLREGGLMGVIEFAARKLLQKAATTFDQISRLARSASIPVMLVIPEVNLADWENRQAVCWLPGEQTASWYELYALALRRLKKADWEAARQTAWKMSELDGGTCPTAYRLLGKSFLGMGMQKEAQRAFQAEVDSLHYANLSFLGAPQAGSMVKELLKRLAVQHGFIAVSLPEIFKNHTGDNIPGRRLFLDYCHLTVEGMQLAMAAVSAQLIRHFYPSEKKIGEESPLTDFPEPQLSPEADATAKFGAAIHCAHRLLTVDGNTEIIEYWCREALKASPGIRQSMLDLVSARLSGLPAVLTSAQQKNTASPYRLMMQHGWKYGYWDIQLIQTIWKVLDTDEERQQKILLENYRIPEEGVELIHPPSQLWEPHARFFPEVMDHKDITHPAFFRAAWPESAFAFVADPERSVWLNIVARLPKIEGWDRKRTGELMIKVNGQTAGKMDLGEKWSNQKIRIPPSFITRSLNQLGLHWPRLPACGDIALESAIQRLEKGLQADLHPVFGEVFSLRLQSRL
jgi:hypothetical protein